MVRKSEVQRLAAHLCSGRITQLSEALAELGHHTGAHVMHRLRHSVDIGFTFSPPLHEGSRFRALNFKGFLIIWYLCVR